ncbi:hypothetical protein E2562_034469 [Oryza meyeriana var. granulata]|uniref:Retroviral polymerase SH3-like domain-containing protein n=1 Tax=Oryza meyeriana var. granulata TaxID=110450 RepID=A0A6G1ESI1_9ORYZ|nr:hypothetical protein E2562_034469 [Oryza meyeriana var. granulata]
MYDPVTQRVCVSRDVVFDEEAFWDWSSPGDDQDRDDPAGYMEFTVENFTVPELRGVVPDPAAATYEAVSPSTASTPATGSQVEMDMPTGSMSSQPPGVEFCFSPSNASTGTDEAPQRYRTVTLPGTLLTFLMDIVQLA